MRPAAPIVNINPSLTPVEVAAPRSRVAMSDASSDRDACIESRGRGSPIGYPGVDRPTPTAEGYRSSRNEMTVEASAGAIAML
jgi:hypothetical protein